MSEILGTLFKYLLSLLGVAAVVLILYQVMGSNKTQTAVSDIALLQANSQALYNGQSTFTTLTNTVAIAAKLAPSDMISGATLINPWGGAVNILVNATNSSQFDINTISVPPEACAKIAVSFGNVVALKIGAALPGAAQALPVDAGSVAAACNNPSNALTFTFAR